MNKSKEKKTEEETIKNMYLAWIAVVDDKKRIVLNRCRVMI